MEHAIRHEIHVKLDENPAFFASLRERLEKIIEDRKAQRIDAAKQLELLEAIRKDIRDQARTAERLGLSEAGFAIYGLLVGSDWTTAGEGTPPYGTRVDEAASALASLLDDGLATHTSIVDWAQKEDVQREMRRFVKRQLRAAKYPDERIETLAESVVDLMKRRRAG